MFWVGPYAGAIVAALVYELAFRDHPAVLKKVLSYPPLPHADDLDNTSERVSMLHAACNDVPACSHVEYALTWDASCLRCLIIIGRHQAVQLRAPMAPVISLFVRWIQPVGPSGRIILA